LIAYLRADFESWEKSVGTRIFTMYPIDDRQRLSNQNKNFNFLPANF
jgi:hypothetical protein